MSKLAVPGFRVSSRKWNCGTGLAAKLATTRSVPEAIDACQECVAQRIQMIAEDGQQLSENSQEIMKKIARPLSEWKARGPKS
jgi:hypothetical protein